MLSFHNDPAIKEKYINRVKAHIEADNLIRGTGWNGKRGCAIGCTLEAYDHSQYLKELGLPEWFAYLEDRLFEGMSEEKSRTWPLKCLEAIPVGVDIENVKYTIGIWRMQRTMERIENNKENYAKEVRSAINEVIVFLQNCADGKYSAESAESAARSAARSAAKVAKVAKVAKAASAVESAAWNAARSVESVAWNAARSVESVAWNAARSVESAAWSAAWSVESAVWSADSAAESTADSAVWSAESAENAAKRSEAYDEESDELLAQLAKCK